MEALILAAQDDCIYTHSFKVNCMGGAGDIYTVINVVRELKPSDTFSANTNQRGTTFIWNSKIVFC